MAEGGKNQVDTQRRKRLHSPHPSNKNINNDKGISEDGINQRVSLSSIDKRRRIGGVSRKGYSAGATQHIVYCAPSRMPLMSGTLVRSARKGIKSVSSASCGSLNHDDTGTALFGWKM